MSPEDQASLHSPSWQDIPLLFTHIAMDKDGSWWGYNYKPVPHETGWGIPEESFALGKIGERLVEKRHWIYADKVWKATLQSRPHSQPPTYCPVCETTSETCGLAIHGYHCKRRPQP